MKPMTRRELLQAIGKPFDFLLSLQVWLIFAVIFGFVGLIVYNQGLIALGSGGLFFAAIFGIFVASMVAYALICAGLRYMFLTLARPIAAKLTPAEIISCKAFGLCLYGIGAVAMAVLATRAYYLELGSHGSYLVATGFLLFGLFKAIRSVLADKTMAE